MLERARTGFPERTFLVGDALELTLPARSVDAVFLLHNVIDALHPLARRTALLQRCAHWLVDGGMVMCSTHEAHPADEVPGYRRESYHGVVIVNYGSTMAALVGELAVAGFDTQALFRTGPTPAPGSIYAVARPTR